MSDYGGFRTILEEAKQIATDERDKQPEACPNDGSPLVWNERLNMLGCPMGDYRTSGRPREM